MNFELIALNCEARVSGSLSGSLLSIMFYIAIKSFQALLKLSRQALSPELLALSCEAALNSSLKLLLVAVVIFIIGCYFYVAHSKIFIK